MLAVQYLTNAFNQLKNTDRYAFTLQVNGSLPYHIVDK